MNVFIIVSYGIIFKQVLLKTSKIRKRNHRDSSQTYCYLVNVYRVSVMNCIVFDRIMKHNQIKSFYIGYTAFRIRYLAGYQISIRLTGIIRLDIRFSVGYLAGYSVSDQGRSQLIFNHQVRHTIYEVVLVQNHLIVPYDGILSPVMA